MAKGQNKHQNNRETSVDDSVTVELEQLRGRYAEFRRSHKPRMRIPEELREAALEAIVKGIPEKSVRDACGISPEQLNRWREIQWLRGRGKGGPKVKPRVFKVVDAPVEEKTQSSQKTRPSAPVQLRIGGWEICVRQLEG